MQSTLFFVLSGSFSWSSCARSFCPSTSLYLQVNCQRNRISWEYRSFIRCSVSSLVHQCIDVSYLFTPSCDFCGYCLTRHIFRILRCALQKNVFYLSGHIKAQVFSIWDSLFFELNGSGLGLWTFCPFLHLAITGIERSKKSLKNWWGKWPGSSCSNVG